MYTCFLFTYISTDVIIDFSVYLRKNKQYTQHTYIKNHDRNKKHLRCSSKSFFKNDEKNQIKSNFEKI